MTVGYVAVAFIFGLHVADGADWTIVSVPLLTVIVLGVTARTRTYFYLRRLNGDYHGYNLDGSGTKEQVTTFQFGLTNLARVRPILELRQVGKRGDWESFLPVSDATPLHAKGFFRYTKDGESTGSKKGHWGIHEIHIAPDRSEIHVDAIGKVPQGRNEYVLRPVDV